MDCSRATKSGYLGCWSGSFDLCWWGYFWTGVIEVAVTSAIGLEMVWYKLGKVVLQ
ncbi:hypothetical protein GE21DRAFT_1279481 [Neurospora crassa]|nr:hypothetical protein GE21DRAFT_1279481 [Neurospora crassa]